MTSLAKYDYIDIEDNPDFKSLRVKNIRSFIKLIQPFQVKIVSKNPVLRENQVWNSSYCLLKSCIGSTVPVIKPLKIMKRQ